MRKAKEMHEKKEQLEAALLDFILRTLNEPLQENSVNVLPAMIHELRELWKS